MNHAPLTHLGDMPIETFLKEYWHKKPCVIRNALPDFEPLLSADELAGLACEEEVESRLLIGEQQGHSWQLKHGPFDDDAFGSLPEKGWTLLVQAVDHWLPEAADFLDKFRFVPSWRMDDLMISYAVDEGGVGAHYDNYDVFLVQAEGTRRWEYGGLFDSHSELKPDLPVKIIADWAPEEVVELNAGDILYLPPRVGHNGTAVGDDCITYSVGFRAPSMQEILRDYTDYLGERMLPEQRYADANLALQANSGEISAAAIAQLKAQLIASIEKEENLAQWFGKAMTEPKYAEIDPAPEEEMDAETLVEMLQEGAVLRRTEGCRFAWTAVGDGGVTLFADGASFPCPPAAVSFVQELCHQRELEGAKLVALLNDPAAQAMLQILYNQGSLYLENLDG
ncbi:JmjC domain-containing protein [Pokkaliibacter sp. CJK22405]|uniref:ribosomal protein uL16 3-hydroxylase n=1 Tax=Pokkaliibacter sp. CJK22405 TaxID=3384615 RepID=UPI00398545D8